MDISDQDNIMNDKIIEDYLKSDYHKLGWFDQLHWLITNRKNPKVMEMLKNFKNHMSYKPSRVFSTSRGFSSGYDVGYTGHGVSYSGASMVYYPNSESCNDNVFASGINLPHS